MRHANPRARRVVAARAVAPFLRGLEARRQKVGAARKSGRARQALPGVRDGVPRVPLAEGQDGRLERRLDVLGLDREQIRQEVERGLRGEGVSGVRGGFRLLFVVRGIGLVRSRPRVFRRPRLREQSLDLAQEPPRSRVALAVLRLGVELGDVLVRGGFAFPLALQSTRLRRGDERRLLLVAHRRAPRRARRRGDARFENRDVVEKNVPFPFGTVNLARREVVHRLL